MRQWRVPAGIAADLVRQLDQHSVVHGVLNQPFTTVPAALAIQIGVTAGLCIGMRRGDEIVGIQSIGYRGRREPLTRRELRIAHGIAQIGSLALDHARTLEQLSRANQLKSEFLATMSHELRTP